MCTTNRTSQLSQIPYRGAIALIRALAVHAKDENARRFYEHFGFIPSPTDPLHLYLLVKDIKRLAYH